MASLSSDQKSLIARWAAEGATLNTIQARLKEECGISLTYLEARMLMVDLGIKLADKPKEPEPAPPPAAAPATDESAGAEALGDAFDDEPAADSAVSVSGGAAGKVTVTVDELAAPGTMVSGKVTFSDGKTASWYLDQMGRLGLRAAEPGYQPPPADIPAFQEQLHRLLA